MSRTILGRNRIYRSFGIVQIEQISHQLTHRVLDLSINIYKSEKEFKIQTNKNYKWIKKDKIKEYGIPKPINKLMNEL